ncbi:MAG: alpha/beta fold hydrolase, partial [Chloroflexota bacterium]
VHGGGHGGWCYQRVARLLQSAGHVVYAPTLTGLGERAHLLSADVDLDMHIRDVVTMLQFEDLHEVILVGHSYGGMVVTGVADQMPERITHLVYLDAFLPQDGQSLYDLGGGGQRPSGWLVPGPARGGDPTDPDVQWNAARRVDHPRATLEEKVHLAAATESRPFSLTYIQATGREAGQGGGFFDQCAERLRSNPRWTVRQISGGHGMIRTNPEGTVRLFQELFPG